MDTGKDHRPARAMAAAGAVCGFLSVAAGAFGAHALAGDPRAAGLMDTAAGYGLAHALLIIAYLATGSWQRLVPGLLLAGIMLFSGSLAALALGAPGKLGMVTPFGGLALLAAWAAIAIEAWLSARGPRR